MTDVDWGTEDNQAKPKKRVPTWVWIGGGCCGVALLGLIAVVVGSIWIGKRTMDQDTNWADLARSLPYEEGYDSEDRMIIRIPLQPGVDDVFQIASGDDEMKQVSIRIYSKRADAVRKDMFEDLDTDTFRRHLGVLKVVDAQASKVAVQGRELNSVGFLTHEPSEDEADKPKEEFGVMDAFKLGVRVVDATPEGHEGLVLVQINKLGANQPPSDEEVATVLAPFLIGPNR
jgi:hypothetical protein